MKLYALLLLILLAAAVLPAFAQEATPEATVIPAINFVTESAFTT